MKTIKTIIQEVESGKYPSFSRSFKSTHLYTIFTGKNQIYLPDPTMPGVTVHYQNRYEPSTTIVYCSDINRAIQLVTDIEKKKSAIHESQLKLGEYIRENKLY